MKKQYIKIEFSPCQTIESAIKELKEHEDLVCGSFNGKTLYSDVDDLNSAFKKITGKTKSEFDEAIRIENEKYQQEKKEHKKAIPKLTIEWIEKGNKILDEKYHKDWAECVPIRLGDLYKGMELGCCLEIVTKLNNGCDLKTAKGIINKQGHSGMSFSLVCSMVRSFCNRGNSFVKFVNKQN